MFPGEYIYLKQAYGDQVANAFLLTCGFIKYPAVTVILCQSSISYLSRGIRKSNPSDAELVLYSIVAVVAITVLVSLSTKVASSIISILNTFKVIGLISIIVFGIYYVISTQNKIAQLQKLGFSNSTTDPRMIMMGFFGCVSSYDGWNALSMVAGEVSNSENNIVIGNSIAMPTTMLLYVAASASYIVVLPESLMKTSTAVASDLGKIAAGVYGEVYMIICVQCSALATIIALAICNSRLLTRAARNSQIPSLFSLRHAITKTPLFSIVLHCLVVVCYSLITSLQLIVNILVIVSWWFYLLCFTSVVYLRCKDTMKPKFQVPIFMPVILIAFSIVLIITPSTVPDATRISFIASICLLSALFCVSYLSALKNLPIPKKHVILATSKFVRNWFICHLKFERSAE